MGFTVGCDEAGVGALMGDLVAAAVFLPDEFDATDINDSKKISERKRNKMAESLKSEAFYGMGYITAQEIDTIGMARCRRLVFERALDDFKTKYNIIPSRILIDGTLFDGWNGIPFECHIKGDQKFKCIAAASILAKTDRDSKIKLICEDKTFEKYEWLKNKGYPTQIHRNAIKQHGLTSYHRKSYNINL